MTPKIKNLIVFIIISIIIILAYIFLIKKGPEEAPLVSITDSTETSPDLQLDSSITQDFLSVLLNVKNIKLNDTIFSDPAFSSLSDSSILLTPDNTEGRSNPFAPLGFDATPIAPATTPAPTGPSIVTPPGGTTPPSLNTPTVPN